VTSFVLPEFSTESAEARVPRELSDTDHSKFKELMLSNTLP